MNSSDPHASSLPMATLPKPLTSLPNRFLPIEIVLDRTSLSRSALYRLLAEDEFPRQVRLGKNSVAWVEAEVEAWIQSRIAAREA